MKTPTPKAPRARVSEQQFQKDIASLAKMPMSQFLRVLDKMKTQKPPAWPALVVRGIKIDHTKADMESFYAVIPTGPKKQDARQARRIVNAAPFLLMTEEEQVEAIAFSLYCSHNPAPHVPLPVSVEEWRKGWSGKLDMETKERYWLRPARAVLAKLKRLT